MLFQTIFVLFYCFLESEIERVGNQGVAYRHLVEVWHALMEELEILQAEVVAGVDAESGFVGGDGRLHKRRYGCLRVVGIVA